MNVLFLCTGNSCRSLICEAVFNQLAPAGWQAQSAGSDPAGRLNERALALLSAKGIATAGYFSKSWHDLGRVPDLVITVCASAAGETCPVYLGLVLRSHWGVDDPSHVAGSEAGIAAAFEHAYAVLRARIEAFLRLLPGVLQGERASVQARLDAIGRIDGTAGSDGAPLP